MTGRYADHIRWSWTRGESQATHIMYASTKVQTNKAADSGFKTSPKVQNRGISGPTNGHVSNKKKERRVLDLETYVSG